MSSIKGLLRTARIDFLQPRSSIQCRCFHASISSHLPNPYSKRPTELPKPAASIPKGPEGSKEHGLWAFFREQRSVSKPETTDTHGRAWAAEELRHKSFDDLHTLWYKCILELNIMATEGLEARRQGLYFAVEDPHKRRSRVVRTTMRRIKFVLWERYRAWWGAYQLNEEDPLLVDKMRNAEPIPIDRGKGEVVEMTEERKAEMLRLQKEAEKRKLERKRRRGEQARKLELYQKLAVGGGVTEADLNSSPSATSSSSNSPPPPSSSS